ncbi:tetraspanin-18-like [Dreissena polymorpha]|uniref:Tetraspanin n=1 Tax=Dreissena polymorpha TaxID=45954 RepID=A0A9D3Y5T6_DREPO|nr:tetraspanin-18-like [Dreissena polymorpha]XP_052258886.1 tetraspanin-18-like [Dreissena polymorpha]XP_052258887.1 tetraspanin-18-like [Dreissena polymorpha]KAH3692409.1 hypothetical protein DPMN_194859 [Dreissena polymorpha]
MAGCLAQIARLLLVIINIVFLLLGLAVTAIGFILRYGYNIYKPFLETGLNQLEKALMDTKLGSFDVKSIDIGEVLLSLSVGLIIGGLVLFGLAFFGCCGACCKFKLFLWIYAIVIVVFILIEAIGIGLLYGKPDIVKDQAKSSLSGFEGLASEKVPSLAWNVIMIQFKCCGVDSYTDFSVATKWNNNPGGFGKIDMPLACCKSLPSSQSANAADCAKETHMALNNGETGCYGEVWGASFGKTAIAVPVLVICGIIQILFIVFAVMVAKGDNDRVSPI